MSDRMMSTAAWKLSNGNRIQIHENSGAGLLSSVSLIFPDLAKNDDVWSDKKRFIYFSWCFGVCLLGPFREVGSAARHNSLRYLYVEAWRGHGNYFWDRNPRHNIKHAHQEPRVERRCNSYNTLMRDALLRRALLKGNSEDPKKWQQ